MATTRRPEDPDVASAAGASETVDLERWPIAGTLAMLQGRANDSGGFGLWSSSPQTARFRDAATIASSTPLVTEISFASLSYMLLG